MMTHSAIQMQSWLTEAKIKMVLIDFWIDFYEGETWV